MGSATTKYRRSRRHKYGLVRYNYDHYDGLHNNTFNRNYLVSSSGVWNVDQMAEGTITYYDDDSPMGARRGVGKSINRLNQRKQIRINGYKGKVNGDEM